MLAGRSPEEALVPYQPFVEALRHYFMTVSARELRSSAREYGSELIRLVPELRRRAPELPPPIDSEPETERYRLFEAVAGLLTEISATAPVLLVLDDLQWADRPTLLLLRHIARAPGHGRVLVLGAYRATEAHSAGFTAALAELRRERLITQIEIVGLSESETTELVELRAGGRRRPRRSAAPCTRRRRETRSSSRRSSATSPRPASGPTRRARRVLGHFGLPEGVKDVIARRLARLDTEATEWLRVAAVIGRDFDAGLLERVLSLDEDGFLNALDAALEAGLVAESPAQPERYSFSHALIRETLYDGMSARAPRPHPPARRRGARGRRTPSASSPRSRCTSPVRRAPRTPRRRSSTRCAPASRRRRCSPTRRQPSTTRGRSRCSSGSTPTPTPCGASCSSGSARPTSAPASARSPGRRSARRPRSRSGSATAASSRGRRSAPRGATSRPRASSTTS